MKREYYHNVKCSFPGCGEWGHYRAYTRREYMDICKCYSTWTCVRHSRPNEVLSASNSVVKKVEIIVALQHGKFWAAEDTLKAGSGLQYGPGFKAFADDFPVGTKLIVTARIEIPAQKIAESGHTVAQQPQECNAG